MEPDVKLAEFVGRHILRMAGSGRLDKATVYPAPRTKEGWLEWLVQYEFQDGGKLTVGVIQRQPGAEVESHS